MRLGQSLDIHIHELQVAGLGKDRGDGNKAQGRHAALLADKLERVFETPESIAGNFRIDKQGIPQFRHLFFSPLENRLAEWAKFDAHPKVGKTSFCEATKVK